MELVATAVSLKTIFVARVSRNTNSAKKKSFYAVKVIDFFCQMLSHLAMFYTIIVLVALHICSRGEHGKLIVVKNLSCFSLYCFPLLQKPNAACSELTINWIESKLFFAFISRLPKIRRCRRPYTHF